MGVLKYNIELTEYKDKYSQKNQLNGDLNILIWLDSWKSRWFDEMI